MSSSVSCRQFSSNSVLEVERISNNEELVKLASILIPRCTSHTWCSALTHTVDSCSFWLACRSRNLYVIGVQITWSLCDWRADHVICMCDWHADHVISMWLACRSPDLYVIGVQITWSLCEAVQLAEAKACLLLLLYLCVCHFMETLDLLILAF